MVIFLLLVVIILMLSPFWVEIGYGTVLVITYPFRALKRSCLRLTNMIKKTGDNIEVFLSYLSQFVGEKIIIFCLIILFIVLFSIGIVSAVSLIFWIMSF